MRARGLAPASPHWLLPTWHCLLPLPTVGREVIIVTLDEEHLSTEFLDLLFYIHLSTCLCKDLPGSMR